MNGIWVRSENGQVLVSTNNIYVSKMVDGRICLNNAEDNEFILATFKTMDGAIRQLDDIQIAASLFGTAMQKHQQNPTSDGTVTYTVTKPKIYDLRERKVKEE